MKQLMERYNILQFIRNLTHVSSPSFSFLIFKKKLFVVHMQFRQSICQTSKTRDSKGKFHRAHGPGSKPPARNSSQKLRTIRDETGVVERNEPSSGSARKRASGVDAWARIWTGVKTREWQTRFCLSISEISASTLPFISGIRLPTRRHLSIFPPLARLSSPVARCE